jgi:hypothetical protein
VKDFDAIVIRTNEVTPYTRSNYSVELFLYNDSTEATRLEWRRIFTGDLSRLNARPVVEHNNAGIQVYFERALEPLDAGSFHMMITS